MLILHAHPLSSFCMKVEMALYEAGTPFRFEYLDLADEAERARFLALWPIGKMPVLVDEAAGETVPETSIIIEYLDAFHPGPDPMIPRDLDSAWRARLWDRFYDLHIHSHMQRYVDFRREQLGARDVAIPDLVKSRLATAFDVVEARMADREWSVGEVVSIADCAAAPALFYADRIVPLKAAHPNTAAYLDRLKARPSFARALREAEPYFSWLPF